MISFTVIDRDDRMTLVEFPNEEGYNIMEALKAMDFDVQGTCGGMALCASCHVYIESDNDLNAMSQDEILMLDNIFDVNENSRLACQIKLGENCQNLIMKLAPNQ